METNELTPEQKAVAAIEAKVAELFDKKDKASKAEVKTLTDELAALKTSKADVNPKMNDEVVRLATELKALKEVSNEEPKVGKSLHDALVDAFAEKKTEIDEIVNSGGRQKAALRIEIKSVGVMTVASTIGAGSTFNTITENTGLISPIRKRELSYLANVSVGSISGNRAVWIEETDEEGVPIMIGEGSAKTQLDVQYVEQTIAVKKIGVYGKVSTELMADLPQLISYIESNLQRRMDIVVENQLLSGDGNGNNLKGAITYATAFSAGSLLNQIVDANELDVLEAIALQTKVAYGTPNVALINPATMSKIKLIKDANGRPVWKDYVTIDGSMKISGMSIVETTSITAGSFLAGDMTVVHVLNREGLSIQIGLDGNDFTNNLKTILLERRLVQYVSGNDVAVLVKGTFAQAILDLDSVLS